MRMNMGPLMTSHLPFPATSTRAYCSPISRKEFAKKKQIEAIKTFGMSLVIAGLFTAAIFLIGYTPK